VFLQGLNINFGGLSMSQAQEPEVTVTPEELERIEQSNDQLLKDLLDLKNRIEQVEKEKEDWKKKAEERGAELEGQNGTPGLRKKAQEWDKWRPYLLKKQAELMKSKK
jgi:uncharacterized protein YhaN